MKNFQLCIENYDELLMKYSCTFSISNENLGQWCQSVISLFSLILKEKLEPKQVPSQPNGIENRHKHQEKQELECNGNDSQEDNRVCSGSLLKMMGMTILDIVKLKKTGDFYYLIITSFF